MIPSHERQCMSADTCLAIGTASTHNSDSTTLDRQIGVPEVEDNARGPSGGCDGGARDDREPAALDGDRVDITRSDPISLHFTSYSSERGIYGDGEPCRVCVEDQEAIFFLNVCESASVRAGTVSRASMRPALPWLTCANSGAKGANVHGSTACDVYLRLVSSVEEGVVAASRDGSLVFYGRGFSNLSIWLRLTPSSVPASRDSHAKSPLTSTRLTNVAMFSGPSPMVTPTA